MDRATPFPPPHRVALVLGAGGTVGCAYHAGVLFGLHHHTGWDVREARTIVGTSAGALMGALIRVGAPPDELPMLVRAEAVPRDPAFRMLHDSAAAIELNRAGLLLAARPPSVRSALRSLYHRSPVPWLLSATRGARLDLRPLLADLDRLCPGGWPDADLRVCTVVAETGERRVLDGSSAVALSTAVAASCAVPGLFTAQPHRRRHLVDGGVHSATNADVLDEADLAEVDELWVIAPMAGARHRSGLDALMFGRFEADLRNELTALPSGLAVRVFTPGPESSHVMGLDLMSSDRSDATVLAAFLEAGDASTSPAAPRCLPG